MGNKATPRDAQDLILALHLGIILGYIRGTICGAKVPTGIGQEDL